jgi:SAM-dependent methyltransferase
VTRTPIGYFERLYAASEDPWDMAASWYEQRKYALTVASLPERRYRGAFEPGCSIGALSEHLAPRCDQLLAVDHLPAAVATAQRRLRDRRNVRVEQRAVPEGWPSGPFDLLVLSEMAYYFPASDLKALMEVALRSLTPGATVVAVHWRGETDYPLTGDETHALLRSIPVLELVVSHEEEAFLLDVWKAGVDDA